MKFVADECCDEPIVEGLRSDGHDVLTFVKSPRGETERPFWPWPLAKSEVF